MEAMSSGCGVLALERAQASRLSYDFAITTSIAMSSGCGRQAGVDSRSGRSRGRGRIQTGARKLNKGTLGSLLCVPHFFACWSCLTTMSFLEGVEPSIPRHSQVVGSSSHRCCLHSGELVAYSVRSRCSPAGSGYTSTDSLR